MSTRIQSRRILTPDGVRAGYVYLDGGRIADVTDAARPCDTMVDVGDDYVSPGFIDLHVHGGAGHDFAGTVDDVIAGVQFHLSHGTTSICPTVSAAPFPVMAQAAARIGCAKRSGRARANILGAHLEGPFLAKEYKGAMPEALLREGDENLLRAYQNRFPGVIRYITVSPEVPGVVDMIGKISQDVTVAIGHSGADYDTSMEAIRRGARCVTHTFNAMRLFHQHQPAIMGAALESDCWCEAICDGRHLHPGTVRMLLKCKGWDRVIAITDSIMAAGLPDGNYKLGVNDVVVRDGDAVLASNGVRAGSTLTLAQALRNIVAFTDHPVQDVIPLMTANPAKALRMDDRKGSIEVGKDADMVLLDDALNVVTTVGLGRVIYTA